MKLYASERIKFHPYRPISHHHASPSTTQHGNPPPPPPLPISLLLQALPPSNRTTVLSVPYLYKQIATQFRPLAQFWGSLLFCHFRATISQKLFLGFSYLLSFSCFLFSVFIFECNHGEHETRTCAGLRISRILLANFSRHFPSFWNMTRLYYIHTTWQLSLVSKSKLVRCNDQIWTCTSTLRNRPFRFMALLWDKIELFSSQVGIVIEFTAPLAKFLSTRRWGRGRGRGRRRRKREHLSGTFCRRARNCCASQFSIFASTFRRAP